MSRELTKTLLLHDFAIPNWNIPIDRLCPPIPNRLNYLHWIEDLLHQSGIDPFSSTIRGIDIGTGASCIYPLLGAQMNHWYFLATESDEISFNYAKTNVAKSTLEQYITLQRVSTVRLLQEPLRDGCEMYHFSMCNPPFFSHMEEADTNPDTCCMGNRSEMVFPGGEVAFIGHMIEDSLELRDRIMIYTSMIGRKGSLRKLLAQLRQYQISNVASTEFLQGRTKRWGIAWSFSSRTVLSTQKKVLGKRKEAHRRQEHTFQVPTCSKDLDYGCHTLEEVVVRIQEHISKSPDYQLNLLEKGSTEQVFRIRCTRSLDDENQMVFQGRIECAMRNDEGFDVMIKFEQGERDKFWVFSDGLQGATIRSGRQWRRKKNSKNKR